MDTYRRRRIVTATLADGNTGSVLDLPSGSKAVSPAVCVASNFPVGRMRTRNVLGGEGVQFFVSYAGTKTAIKPKNTGQVHGGPSAAWTLSDPVNLQPGKATGWQQVQFTLVPGGTSSDFQVYNF